MQGSGLLLHVDLQLDAYSVGLFSSWLCCPLRLQDSSQTLWWEGFLLFGNFFFTPSLGLISVLNSFVSLFVFYILSYFLSMRMGCLSGCLVSSTSIQLFCGIFSEFKGSFDEFVGEKMSYSSILGPPPLYQCLFLRYCTLSFSVSLSLPLSLYLYFFFGNFRLNPKYLFFPKHLLADSHMLLGWVLGCTT